MRDELDLFAHQAKRQRVATMITTVASAAVLVPIGTVLLQRDEPQARSIGWGMALGGGVPFLFVFPAFFSSPLERLRDTLEERRASGMPSSEIVRLTEADWEQAAISARKTRITAGIILLAVGVGSAAAGSYFLLADPIGKMGRDDQYILGSSLAGPGIALAAGGVRALIQPSVEETSFDAYRAAKAPATKRRSALAIPALTVAPLRGGGAALATFTF